MPYEGMVKQSTEHYRIRPGLRMLWRYFVTGANIRGAGDNASWLHDATEDYREKPVKRYSRARWRRVARRNLAVSVPLLLLLAAPWWTLWPLAGYLSALVGGVGWWAGRRAVRAWRRRRLHREWLYPAARVACTVLAIGFTRRRARAMLSIPLDWGSGADHAAERSAVRVSIPPKTVLSPKLKATLVGQVGNRLGIPTPQGDWQEAGEAVSVVIKAAPVPPAEVTPSDLRKAIELAEDTEIVVGRAPGGAPVVLSTAEDSPHFLLSGPSGTGKSVLGKLALAQRLHRGDGMIMLDPKRWSHWRWAGPHKIGTDRVIYAYRTEDIHHAWIAVGAESERRIELEENELAEVRRVWIAVEEINTQTKRLTRWWKGERRRLMAAAKAAKDADMDYDEADLDPPATSPAVVAMQESVGMGRELKMHVFVMAQRASASVFGGNGGDIRESFQGGRLIARWDRKLWKMLVDTLAYVACPVGPRGIWGVARGEDFTVFRVPNLSDAQATDMATSGVAATGPVLGQQDVSRPVRADNKDALSGAVSLSDALAALPGQDGPHALSLEGLRTASKRPNFPEVVATQGRTNLYDLSSLIIWREIVLEGKQLYGR